MATYKKPCLHCGQLIDGAASFCPSCGSRSPFGYLCPKCKARIDKTQRACVSCGRLLYIECPHCKQPTFVQDSCERCGKSLMKQCRNKRCLDMQFFENKTCTSCGKKL
ncbi:MAG: zinc ribbon domain-containing protein [Clostridia bacterium]|nr:zinc ribbon domain-containing protein [Clostridia bacterium]